MSEQLHIDAEFDALLAPLHPDDLARLEASIKADGVRESLVAWPCDGRLLLVDGHNRHRIATSLGLPVKVQRREFASRDEAKLFIIDNQLARRNVADIDRVALTERAREIVAGRARQCQSQAGGDKKSLRAKVPEAMFVQKHVPPTTTRAVMAKSIGMAERTYDAHRTILEAAKTGEIKPEVVEDVRLGRAAPHRVAKDIRESRQKQEREAKRTEAVKQQPILDNIIVGDFREHADRVPDGSVSLIFTDPPYDREATKVLPELAKFAAAKLADGGSLVMYVGTTQMPDALEAIRQHLRYWWTIACVHSGRATVMREYGVNAGWKPVLWFVKGTRHDNSVMLRDTLSGGEEKALHDWQQSQVEAQYVIEKLTSEGDLVCDPYLGSGTTAAAAKMLGRRWIGFERNPDTARIASGRLA
jgi:16S rRNA G966 N2-methylase RsmD